MFTVGFQDLNHNSGRLRWSYPMINQLEKSFAQLLPPSHTPRPTSSEIKYQNNRDIEKETETLVLTEELLLNSSARESFGD